MYIARVYEKITGSKNIYSGKKLLIPQPEFIVLYNGTAPYPDKNTLKLSDSFEDAASSGLVSDRRPGPERSANALPALELIVNVYNINKDHNDPLVFGCQRLTWYSAFIAKVREYEKTAPDKETAMKMAIKYCIKHDIMKDFLETNASEVVNMLLTEWNWDDALAVQREEGREEGLEKGREEGEKTKALETAKNALQEGLAIELVRKITGLDLETVNNLLVNQ
jgi:hypothetical protein